MGTESLLHFEPHEISFSFERNKLLSASLQLLNKTENYVAFKLLTTNPKHYGVRPRIKVLSPGSVCEITVTKRAMREAPHNMKCKDKFMIQTAITIPSATTEDARSMFSEAGQDFQECKLRVSYVVPLPEFPSSVAEETTEMMIGNDNPNAPEVTNSVIGPHENVVRIDRVDSNTEDSDLQVIDISRQENHTNFRGELLTRGTIVVLLGLVLCYVMKQTLSLVWSLSMVIIMLIMKMIRKLVSESVEDLIVKTLLYICMHLFFKRRENTRQSSESVS